MRRSFTCALVFGGVAIGAFWFAEVLDAIDPSVLSHLCSRGAEAEEQRRQRNDFMPIIEKTLDEMARGLSVRDATAQVKRAAEERFSNFLHNLDCVEQGPSLDAKLAGYLVSYFDGDLAWRRDSIGDARRAEMVRELQHYFAAQ